MQAGDLGLGEPAQARDLGPVRHGDDRVRDDSDVARPTGDHNRLGVNGGRLGGGRRLVDAERHRLGDLRDLPPVLEQRERGGQAVEPEQDQQHRRQVGGDTRRQDEHGPGQQQQADRGRVDAEQPHRYPGDGQEQQPPSHRLDAAPPRPRAPSPVARPEPGDHQADDAEDRHHDHDGPPVLVSRASWVHTRRMPGYPCIVRGMAGWRWIRLTILCRRTDISRSS